MTDAEQLAAEWERPIYKDHIYSAFLQYAKESGEKATSDSSFWKEMHKIFRPNGAAKSMLEDNATRSRVQLNNEGRKSNENRQVQKQIMAFPSLEISKKLFRENVAHEPAWSFDAQGETIVQDENAQYDDAQLGLKQVFG